MSAEQDMRAWLRQHGAETVGHPGGTLYAHLSRVHDRLGGLGLGADVQLAGLAHAVYGTDGFDLVLLDPADRMTLRDLIGAPAEKLVYLYGACDRDRTWRRLPDTGEVWNRFTNEVEFLDPVALQPFVDLSIVNELDVVEQDPAVAEKYGAYFRSLFTSWAQVASAQVTTDAKQVLGF
ncbi:hypothetical protein O7614_12095 [Micromonospora sp. WMMD961]|uniref:DUF6817 domain-containing protein n=1 Tax=Micromonospora sp. WMMD961 TaxID=3016100 RepID=UPI002417957A|nr:hypothetical protein [Micromonospora sp. WMMD961]MDG4780382.1 hypothetical protein [Micromonospora sp. WMMD961]